jgi:hypothetical protein
MQAQAKIEQPLEAGVATAFEALAWEIELAGARCIFLDALIGDLMPGLPPEQKARMLEGLHAVDLLSQHLAGLSAFARNLSQAAPLQAAVPVDGALAEITLGALADRLRTSLGGEELAADDESDGDCDLF